MSSSNPLALKSVLNRDTSATGRSAWSLNLTSITITLSFPPHCSPSIIVDRPNLSRFTGRWGHQGDRSIPSQSKSVTLVRISVTFPRLESIGGTSECTSLSRRERAICKVVRSGGGWDGGTWIPTLRLEGCNCRFS